MTQTINISGSKKKVKIARIIQKAKNQDKILFILISKNRPRIIRNMMISPLVKK
jgi:hypothetical protein